MRFASPLAFALLLFLPFFFERFRLLPFMRRSRDLEAERSRALLFSSAVDIQALPRTWKVRLREPVLTALGASAFLCLVLALARPQTISSFTEEDSSGRDIMLVLDLSGSMQALDFKLGDEQVNRLSALQSVVSEFVDVRAGDRMGLVVFGDRVYTQCPLTLDHPMLKEYIKGMEVGMAGQGTAIGDAIGIGLKRIKGIEAKSKVLVLVTDGKSNSGSLSPKEGAELAKELDVRIHTIGIGSTAPAPFPVTSAAGETRMVYREMEYDESTLKMIADTTGGRYYNAKDTEALKSVYEAIDKLELREQKELRFVQYHEHFLPLLALGLALYFVSQLLEFTILMAVP